MNVSSLPSLLRCKVSGALQTLASTSACLLRRRERWVRQPSRPAFADTCRRRIFAGSQCLVNHSAWRHSKEGCSIRLPMLRMATVQPIGRLASRGFLAPAAYFSDRGRLFQSEGGRRFSVMADGVSI